MIGILGGMGPQATVDTLDKLIKNTVAQSNQQHIPTITLSIPDIPDRTRAIQNNSQAPLVKMLEYIKILEKTPVSCIIIPCNTAHYWLPQLQQKTYLPILSMIDATIEAIQTQKVCILGTIGTLQMQLYQTACREKGISYTTPSEALQSKIMQSIYAYKAGQIEQAHHLMVDVLDVLNETTYILACTEIPLILASEILKQPKKFIDSTEALVKKAITWYGQFQIAA